MRCAGLVRIFLWLFLHPSDLEAEVDILRVSSENHQKTMEEMERDAAKRIQDAREEEWSKNNSLQNEK